MNQKLRLIRLALLGLVMAVAASLVPGDAHAFVCNRGYCPVEVACPDSQIFNVFFCCPQGTEPVCFYTVDLALGCVKSVSHLCL
ncbi:MAG TPA: hypothetical protein VGX68_08380 [Thermoanaerobaculia bacterium]|jgi:hypothetical protein|nr:hypothetical protein [Thermoanaerobaculia bacterium]